MVLMSCTFGFNIFTIFSFYVKINAKTSYETLATDIGLTVLWSAIYSVPSLLVIFVGALLRRNVGNFFTKRFNLIQFSLQKGRETGILVHKTIHLITDKMAIKQVSLFIKFQE